MWSIPGPETWTWLITRASPPKFVQQVAHYEADVINTYLVMAGRPLYARLQDLPGITG